MNIFSQIRGFYSRVFNQDHELRTTHISLYMFLLNQNNRANWAEWFKCPHDTAMMGALISSKTTYYKCLEELKQAGFIDYQKGVNNFKAPKIKLINLSDEEDIVPRPEPTVSKIDTQLGKLLGTLPEQASVLLSRKLSVLLSGNKDILITNNYRLIAEPIEIVEEKKYIGKIEDHEEVVSLTKQIADYFNISEQQNFHNFSLIGNFVRKNFNDENLPELKKQFKSYKEISSRGNFRHSIKNYIGTPSEKYLDGAWCEKDWSRELAPVTISNVLPARQKSRNPS